MRIITRRRLKEYGYDHADARGPLTQWAVTIQRSTLNSFADLRAMFRTVDEVVVNSGRTVAVFNIKGNRYRLIVAIHYNRLCVYVLRFMTHAEYSKHTWKDDL